MCEKTQSATLCVAIMCVVFCGYVSQALPQQQQQPQQPLGDSSYRQRYAERMLSNMNRTAAPCDDFYEYACGNYKQGITEHLSSLKRNNFFDMKYAVLSEIEQLLEQGAAPAEVQPEFEIVKRVYQLCITAELYPTQASDAHLKLIRSFGGFPAVDGASWQAAKFSWLNMSAHLTNYGAVGLIKEHIWPTYPFEPYFELPELGFDYVVHSHDDAANMSRGYQLNFERMRSYLKAYGVPDDKAVTFINDIFAFWQQILTVTVEFGEDIDTCAALYTNVRFEQWRNYREIAWPGKKFSAPKSVCPCNYFYKRLHDICEKQPEAAANYLAMKFLYALDPQLKHKGQQKEFCLTSMKHSFKVLLNELYMRTYFNDAQTRNDVAAIVEQIQTSLRATLKTANWLDAATRAEALRQELEIGKVIGGVVNDEYTKRIIREIRKLPLSSDGYDEQHAHVRRFATQMARYNGLHNDVISRAIAPEQLRIGMEPVGFYYNIDNTIYVMASIIQPPEYHRTWPYALKFGALGWIVGHELIHAFDTTVAKWDGKGELRPLWSKQSLSNFQNRTKCFIAHYNDIEIVEIGCHVNGTQTLDENIADNGGLRITYLAYQKYLKALSAADAQEERMPGLAQLTPEQLFFLGFAQQWCSAYSEEHYRQELNAAHTIDKYRVLGTLSNSADFAQAYGCALGTKMNPKPTKCSIW